MKIPLTALQLEHRREQVASLRLFSLRLLRYSAFAIMLIALSLGLGVLGYHYIAELGWLDSLHMASMILTGMGPVATMDTNGAKLFSSFYALFSALAFLSVTAVFLAPMVHRLLHILHVEDD